MPIIHPPKRWAYVVIFGILIAPLSLFTQAGVGGIIWSVILVVIGIAGDVDYVNENLDVEVSRWKWSVAALITSVFVGLYYLYRRRIWFNRNQRNTA